MPGLAWIGCDRAPPGIVDRFGHRPVDTVTIAGARSSVLVLMSRSRHLDTRLGEELRAQLIALGLLGGARDLESAATLPTASLSSARISRAPVLGRHRRPRRIGGETVNSPGPQSRATTPPTGRSPFPGYQELGFTSRGIARGTLDRSARSNACRSRRSIVGSCVLRMKSWAHSGWLSPTSVATNRVDP